MLSQNRSCALASVGQPTARALVSSERLSVTAGYRRVAGAFAELQAQGLVYGSPKAGRAAHRTTGGYPESL